MEIASMSYSNRLVARAHEGSSLAASLCHVADTGRRRQVVAAGIRRLRELLAQTMANVVPLGRHLSSVPTADRSCEPATTDCGQVAPRKATPVRPLRVLQVIDGTGSGIGRMVISGRMVDVCAEIERLAASEARQARC